MLTWEYIFCKEDFLENKLKGEVDKQRGKVDIAIA